MAFSEDRQRAFSLKGSVVELTQSLAHRPDARQAAAAQSASSIEAEVETAMSALRRFRTEKSVLEEAVEQQRDEIEGLRQLVADLRTYKEEATRELAAAARLLTAEQERGTTLEHNLRATEAQVKSNEGWNVALRGHLEGLIRSIMDDDPSRVMIAEREASA